MTHDNQHQHEPEDLQQDRPQSLAELLATYQAWSGRDTLNRAAHRAEAGGDAEGAAVLRRLADNERMVSPLDALAAQRQVADLLRGWEWQTIRAAREDGASWSEIAEATRSRAREVLDAYTAAVDQQHRYEHLSDAEAAEHRALAGAWTEQLHPDVPDSVRERIEQATAAGDTKQLNTLRAVWWDPDRHPTTSAGRTADHDTGHDTGRDEDGRDEDEGDGTGGGNPAGPPPPPPPVPGPAGGAVRTPDTDAEAECAAQGDGGRGEGRGDPLDQARGAVADARAAQTARAHAEHTRRYTADTDTDTVADGDTAVDEARPDLGRDELVAAGWGR